MSYPSVKTIMKLECDKEDAIKIRKAMMQESLDVDDRLEKINEILHECGVESAGECDCKDGPRFSTSTVAIPTIQRYATSMGISRL